jgi:hypothetical protein
MYMSLENWREIFIILVWFWWRFEGYSSHSQYLLTYIGLRSHILYLRLFSYCNSEIEENYVTSGHIKLPYDWDDLEWTQQELKTKLWI